MSSIAAEFAGDWHQIMDLHAPCYDCFHCVARELTSKTQLVRDK